MSQEIASFLSSLVTLVPLYRTSLLFLVCLLLGAGGAWLIADIPFRDSLLDHPGHRSSHTVATPRGGGVGILIAFIAAAVTLRVPTTFLFAAVLVSAVSFYGDYFRISVKFRLAIQFLSASIFMLPLLPKLVLFFDASRIGSVVFLFPLILIALVAFVVGTANFYNFMDGINGIAGLSGAIGFGILGLYTLYRPGVSQFEASFSLLSIGLALSCLGYLPFNMPRARVFMGDVGSILLGFVFAALVIVLSRNYRDMICLPSILFPFYADELTTMYARVRAGENLTKAHRSHLYQLLVNDCGIAHWKVATAYGLLQLLVGTAALALYSIGLNMVMLLLVTSFLIFSVVSYKVRKKVSRV